MIVPIVFSKNRPMQLRAHLESMRFYTGFVDPIYVITPTYELYEDIANDFQNVKWIEEQRHGGFHLSLTTLVNSLNDEDIILFSVDDAIYTNYFNLYNGVVLNKLPSVIGLSLRMGINTVPYSDSWNVSGNRAFSIYDWRGKPSHLGYPTDVSLSMYKVGVIKEIFSLIKRPMNIPNDLEAFSVTAVINNLANKYPYYMMNNGLSIAACADLNRTQAIYCNKTQGGEEFTAENMLEMYKQGKRINWSNYYLVDPPEPFLGKTRLSLTNINSYPE